MFSNYAVGLRKLGRQQEALPLFEEALRLRREVLGERHPDTAFSLKNKALTLQELGRVAEAEPLFGEALALRRDRLGDGHADTIVSAEQLVDARLRLPRGAVRALEPARLMLAGLRAGVGTVNRRGSDERRTEQHGDGGPQEHSAPGHRRSWLRA